MPATVGAEAEVRLGEPAVIESSSPITPFAAVFEDDGATGYVYALDTRDTENPIQDALMVYEVANVPSVGRLAYVQIVWSSDGLKFGLILDQTPEVIVDFEARRAVCRSGSPLPPRGWSGHAWDEAAVALLR